MPYPVTSQLCLDLAFGFTSICFMDRFLVPEAFKASVVYQSVVNKPLPLLTTMIDCGISFSCLCNRLEAFNYKSFDNERIIHMNRFYESVADMKVLCAAILFGYSLYQQDKADTLLSCIMFLNSFFIKLLSSQRIWNDTPRPKPIINRPVQQIVEKKVPTIRCPSPKRERLSPLTPRKFAKVSLSPEVIVKQKIPTDVIIDVMRANHFDSFPQDLKGQDKLRIALEKRLQKPISLDYLQKISQRFFKKN